MTSIDLRDAYYSVPIAKDHRKYLQFFWQNTAWQFKALPNGLTSGPRIFTKLLKPPLAFLRSMGLTIISYIDDTLIISNTREQSVKAVMETATTLSDLGFVIHPDKSLFSPTQEIKFLGFIIDSKLMQVRLTPDRKQEIKEACLDLFSDSRHTIREVASTLGKLVATFSAVQYGPLHYRQIEIEKTEALRKNFGHFDRYMTLSFLAKIELQWWLKHVDSAYRDIDKGLHHLCITSDASGLGWGATNGSIETGGRWNAQTNEINYLEMLAAFHALKAFASTIQNQHILVRIDNTTAVAYINHMGGSKSVACHAMAKAIWGWCQQRNIWITAAHIPGVKNKIADRKSRVFNDQLEWMLNKNIFQSICQVFGIPDIDLFASRLNAQVNRYVAWKPDPGAEAIDAFTLNWDNLFFYAFPPFTLIAKCLQKIERDKAEGILIVPKWPTQPWFAKMLNLLVENPIILPKKRWLLTQPTSGQEHPLNNNLSLLSCRLSGKHVKTLAYQQKLSTSFYPLGEIPPKHNIRSISENGLTFAIHNRLIRCRQLPQ